MKVYLLWHMLPLEGQEDLDPDMHYIETDDKLCGAFSSQSRADQARQRLLSQQGFQDYPEAFYTAEHDIDQVEWSEGFVIEAE